MNPIDLARERMTRTGESFAIALQAVLAEEKIIAADLDQSWIAEWVADVAWTEDAESIAWFRERPAILRPLLIRFPPSCVVRPLRALRVPVEGTLGVVESWSEDGSIGVSQSPSGFVRGYCDPDDLQVVAYWRGWTPERMREVLEAT